MKTTSHPIRVVLKLPGPIPQLIVHVGSTISSVGADPKTFPAPSPAMALMTTHLNTLSTCQQDAKTRVEGAVAARDAAAGVVIADMHTLGTYVSGLCNADPANAAAIATEAGMYIRKSSSFTKPPMRITQTVSGTAKVIAKAIKGAKAYDFQYSTDGGKTWLAVPTSTKSSVTVSSLTPGATQFRYRAITKTGVLDWEEPYAATVT